MRKPIKAMKPMQVRLVRKTEAKVEWNLQHEAVARVEKQESPG